MVHDAHALKSLAAMVMQAALVPAAAVCDQQTRLYCNRAVLLLYAVLVQLRQPALHGSKVQLTAV